MPGRSRPALPLAVAALLLGLPALASAASGADAWSRGERTVTAWPDGGGFTLRSSRDSAAGTDEIAADYDAQSASLRVALQATSPDDASLGLALALRAVSEFRDADGDGRLGPTEEVLRRIPVPGTPAVASVTALTGGGWRAVTTHTLPGTASGTATLASPRLEVALEARPAPDGGAAPTQLDLDVRLLDGWALNGTHLALEAGYATDDAPVVSADTARVREDQLSLDASWQDGLGTVVEGSDPRSVSFVRSQPASQAVSFPLAFAAAFHPEGSGGPSPGGSALLYVGAAMMAAAAIAYPAWRRLRT